MRRRWAQLVACSPSAAFSGAALTPPGLPACLPPCLPPCLAPPACPPAHTPCTAVGNFSGPEAADFLSALHRAAGERSQLLLCTDLWKDEEVLRQAYDDSPGERQAAHFTSAERS